MQILNWLLEFAGDGYFVVVDPKKSLQKTGLIFRERGPFLKIKKIQI